MPDVAAAFDQIWRDASDAQAASTQAFRDAAAVQSASTAYARPAVGIGTVIVDPGLTAANVIPEQATYSISSTLEMVDLRNDLALPVESVSMSLTDGSALWALTASGPKELAWILMSGDSPVTVEVRVNGEPWQFVIEQVDQPTTFSGGKAQVRGRSLVALAGAPYWGAQPLIADAPTTAAQVCVIANLLTGLQLDWRVEDWLIDTGEWATVADPVEVVRRMASSVGAVVEASRSGMTLKVSPRYPEMPTYWIDRKPEWEIPWAAIESAGTQRLDKPAYDGIVVTGQAKGDVLAARLVGTAGNNQAPMVSDTNLTDEPALRQRAESELGAAGIRAMETRTLQVHGAVIERGDLVRCVEPMATWVGMVRAVTVDARHGWARQTLGLERDEVDFEMPGDPFYNKVRFLLLGEGTGVVVNPPVGTLTKDEISGNLEALGNDPWLVGATVSADLVDMPFGTSWIRFPGGIASANFIGITGVPNWHPAVEPFCFDGWYQLDDLLEVQCLAGDDSAFGGGNWNWYINAGGSSYVSFSMKVQPASAYSITSPVGSIVAGRPFHVEAWGDGTGRVGLIVDGKHVVEGICPPTSKNPISSSLLMGAQNHWVGTYSRVMTGYAKGLRFTEAVRHRKAFKPPTTLRQYRPF